MNNGTKRAYIYKIKTYKSLSEVLSFVLHLGTESGTSHESTVKGLNASETGNIQFNFSAFTCTLKIMAHKSLFQVLSLYYIIQILNPVLIKNVQWKGISLMFQK